MTGPTDKRHQVREGAQAQAGVLRYRNLRRIRDGISSITEISVPSTPFVKPMFPLQMMEELSPIDKPRLGLRLRQ